MSAFSDSVDDSFGDDPRADSHGDSRGGSGGGPGFVAEGSSARDGRDGSDGSIDVEAEGAKSAHVVKGTGAHHVSHVSHVSQVNQVSAGVGARVERETTPAPAGDDDDDWSVPSVRPTSVPEFDLDAFAIGTALRHQARPRIPVDVTIPVRTDEEAPSDLGLRLAFILLHVDGRSSIRDISYSVALPVEETLNAFLELTTNGLVDLGGPRFPSPADKAPKVPTSGEYARVDVPSGSGRDDDR